MAGRFPWGPVTALVVGCLGAWWLLGPEAEPPGEASTQHSPLTTHAGGRPDAPPQPGRAGGAAPPEAGPTVAGEAQEPVPEPDPTEPRGWHATADAPRWQALGEGLAQREHPLAPVAKELSAKVARAHTLDEAAWADLQVEERQLLGYLGTQPMDEALTGQVSALSGALTALDKQSPVP